jgi:hypothetical protein
MLWSRDVWWSKKNYLFMNDTNTTEHTVQKNRIGDIIVDVIASSAVDCGFDPRPGQTQSN